MKSILQFESVGLKGSIRNVPETFADITQLGIPESTAVGLFVDYVMFHRVLGSFRDDLVDAVILETEVNPKTKNKDGAKPNEKGEIPQVVDEKPALYLARAAAEVGKQIADFQTCADAVCANTDPDKYGVYEFAKFTEERVRQPKLEYAKGDLDLAKQILAYDDEKFGKALSKLVAFDPALTRQSTPEAVAKAIKAFRTAPLAELK